MQYEKYKKSYKADITAKKHNITLKHKLSKTLLPFVTKLSQVLPKLCCINIANKSDKTQTCKLVLFMRTRAGVTDHRGNEQQRHLDAGRHGDVEVAQHVLRVLVLGRLAQEGQEPGGFLIAISHLMSQGK